MSARKVSDTPMNPVLAGPAVRPAAHRLARVRWAWLLLVLAGAAVYPALAENVGAVAFDAATVHIYQGFVFSQAISQGVLFPRWVQFLHWGLGSPIFTFRAPLPYYGMDLLYRLGLGHPLGWRVLMAAGLLAACLGAYLLVRALTGRKWPALLAAVAFLYAPYVLRNVFERGSTEAFGMFLYPWILWALIWLARRPSGVRFAVVVLLWAGCIGSHVLAPLMLAPFALIVALAMAWRYRTLSPLLALLAGGLLMAFVWAPMIPEQRYVHIERDFGQANADPLLNPISARDLLAPPILYDVQRDNNYAGDRLGLLHALLLLAGIPATLYAWRRGQRTPALMLAAATVSGLLLFWMLTGAADPIWRVFSLALERLQFRSRLMGLQALAIAVVAGVGLALLPRRWQPRLAAPLIAGLILLALPSLYVGLRHHYAPFDDTLSREAVRQAEIETGGSAFTSFGEFTPRWRTAPFDAALAEQLGPMFDAAAQPLAEAAPGVRVTSASVLDQRWDLAVAAGQDATLTLHLLYYPRWQATVDGQPAGLRPQDGTGYAQLDVPAGDHTIALRYGSTFAEQAGIAISLATLAGLVVAGFAWSPRRHGLAAAHVPGAGRVEPATSQDTALPPWWLLAGLTAVLAFKILCVDPSTTWLRCRSTAEQVCGAQASVDTPFPGAPRLRGYTVSADPLSPGGTLRMSLFWQGEPGVIPGLYAFVHIRNSQQDWPVNPRTGSDIWTQSDHVAPAGLFSQQFVPGRLYLDDYQLVLPEDMPPGVYLLEVGWFDPASGQQLDPQADAVRPPLKVLWRSVLLPSVTVR